MNARSLCASINRKVVGTLHEQGGLWSFQYSEDWLGNPDHFQLSPHLPLTPELIMDGATTRPVQWYFDNLLPEEGQRVLLAKDARINSADAFGLLAWYGAESAGSLTLQVPDVALPEDEPLYLLPDAELQSRIQALPRVSLTQSAVKRMSLAGAQHKLAVVLQGEALYEPAGSTPSTHILKPNHPDADYPHSVINEWFVMQLAKRMGLQVPGVHRRYVPSPVYLVDRFDRTKTEQAWSRLHAIDACQLLGIDRSFKYSQGSIENLAAIARACRSPAVARMRLFEWMVFNVLVGNADAHLKNLSFLVSSEGVQLAPFYDLLSVAVYETPIYDKTSWPNETRLAWPILDADRFSQINRALLLEASQRMKIARGTAERLLASMLGRVIAESDALYKRVEAENAEIVDSRPDLAATLGGELQCLRAIMHNVLKEMARRLG